MSSNIQQNVCRWDQLFDTTWKNNPNSTQMKLEVWMSRKRFNRAGRQSRWTRGLNARRNFSLGREEAVLGHSVLFICLPSLECPNQQQGGWGAASRAPLWVAGLSHCSSWPFSPRSRLKTLTPQQLNLPLHSHCWFSSSGNTCVDGAWSRHSASFPQSAKGKLVTEVTYKHMTERNHVFRVT